MKEIRSMVFNSRQVHWSKACLLNGLTFLYAQLADLLVC